MTRATHRAVLTAVALGVGLGFALLPAALHAEGLPVLNLSDPSGGNGPVTYSLSFQIVALMTVMTVLPSILLGATAFTRIIIVLSILRQALGTQQTPPNQVLIALALFLTAFIMQPTFSKLYDTSISPYMDGQIEAQAALDQGQTIIKAFLIENTRENDLMMFADMAKAGPFANKDDVPLWVLLPAYMTSELKTAFQIAFLIYLPFLVIDMVVASILMALGMMMLSPMLVSLPLKLLLFVLVDGWALTMGSLAATYGLGG